ncbi:MULTISPECIES: hypothetical protein [unclassified Streptomyces]|uniref:hypothetical protein n=1 Tax=unclassified Streptomyces TaxID=2593676 RepID=UPI003D72EFFE
MALQPSTPRRQAGGEARVPAPAGESDGAAHPAASAAASGEDAPPAVPAQGGDGPGAEHAAAGTEPADGGESRSRTGTERAARRTVQEGSAGDAAAAGAPRKRGRAAARRPSGRERHDEKITVYVSAEELMDLEHARLVLRGEHGLAVDRGRIVREAVAVVLADLEARGDASILVRRLRGR